MVSWVIINSWPQLGSLKGDTHQGPPDLPPEICITMAILQVHIFLCHWDAEDLKPACVTYQKRQEIETCLEALLTLCDMLTWMSSTKTQVNFANFSSLHPLLSWSFTFPTVLLLWAIQKFLFLQIDKHLLFTAARLGAMGSSGASSYLEERSRWAAGSASEPAHLRPWNASSCAPYSPIGCKWHHRGQQASIWVSPGAT